MTETSLGVPATGMGVTYREDIPCVREGIRELIDAGIYPHKLWKDVQ